MRRPEKRGAAERETIMPTDRAERAQTPRGWWDECGRGQALMACTPPMISERREAVHVRCLGSQFRRYNMATPPVDPW